jgi:hypothetical protein
MTTAILKIKVVLVAVLLNTILYVIVLATPDRKSPHLPTSTRTSVHASTFHKLQDS